MREAGGSGGNVPLGVPAFPTNVPGGRGDGDIYTSPLYQELKFRALTIVHDYLEKRGFTPDKANGEVVRSEISRAISVVVAGAGVALNAAERERLLDDVFFEIVGLGPLEPLLADTTVDDIIVNGPNRVYVERSGVLEKVTTRFRDDAHLMNIIQRIVSPIGRRVDEASPFVDARLKDGSRVNIVIPPIALDGATVSIRKFKRIPLKIHDLIRTGTISQEMVDYLAAAVRSRLNVLISGRTGSGKTTMLNILSGFISATERIVTIEDAAELQLRQSHVVRLETRPPSADGTPEITARDLVKNALRMRPDRIILGEIRGGEAVEMVQAMTTGHDGSMATVHANSPQDAMSRLELLLSFGGMKADVATVRKQITSAVQVVVQVQRLSSGARKVISIAEVVGMEGETIVQNERFRYRENPGAPGQGSFVMVTRHSAFQERLATVAGTGFGGGVGRFDGRP
ncbi:CpaF family protein [Zavarzinia compransoris]|uniref:CpaF family protein n=1 Tax=Zavarzinia marina TaxID=2911065 RepID=UPI001F194AA3|nr:CpaF family protein [Zavarzinia marina]MCF4166120.1 CpaF family protein [Zavarzinia marina]